jgi:hypothetical protein
VACYEIMGSDAFIFSFQFPLNKDMKRRMVKKNVGFLPVLYISQSYNKKIEDFF